MSAIWNIAECPYDADDLARRVQALCCECAAVHDALQAPADALVQWYCAQRLKVFRKIDKAGDKSVIAILTTAYAIRDQLGQGGPIYPGMGNHAEAGLGDSGTAGGSSASDGTAVAPTPSDVYTAAPGMCAALPDETEPSAPPALVKGGTSPTPVDIDQPLAFLFGEGRERWHPAAIAWAGQWLADVVASTSLRALIDARSQGKATAMPSQIADISFPNG